WHDSVLRHRRNDGPQRCSKNASNSGQAATKAEYCSQHTRQTDSEQPDHLWITRACTQDAAIRSKLHEGPQGDQQYNRRYEYRQPVLGDQHRTPEVDAGQEGWLAERLPDPTVNETQESLDHQCQREGNDQTDERLL